jgi:hypothetical protein
VAVGIGEDGAVAEGLHDVIVVGAFLCVKEFFDGFGSLWFVAGFIIDNAYAVTCRCEEQIETVDVTSEVIVDS